MAIIVRNVRLFFKDNTLFSSSADCEIHCDEYVELHYNGNSAGIAKIRADDVGIVADLAFYENQTGNAIANWKDLVAYPLFIDGTRNANGSYWDSLTVSDVVLSLLPRDHSYARLLGRLSDYEYEIVDIK